MVLNLKEMKKDVIKDGGGNVVGIVTGKVVGVVGEGVAREEGLGP